MDIIGKITIDGDEYGMDQMGRWHGPDEYMANALITLGGEGLSVMPPGYNQFGVVVAKMRGYGREVEVTQPLPELPPLPEGAIS